MQESSRNSVPTFDTARLALKPVTLADADSYARHFVDYEVIAHLSAVVPWPYPEKGVTEYLANVVIPNQGKDRWAWGIFLKEDPETLIGCVDLWREYRPENRGFWLGRKFWNRGIMSEALVPITRFAFTQLGFEKLVFANALGNVRSRRIKEKVGARLLGVEPGKFVDPRYTEKEVWELNKKDWSRGIDQYQRLQ